MSGQESSQSRSDGQSRRKLGFASGVGLVVSETVGIGILTTTGFMAGALTPAQIMSAWVVGGLAALCGAWAYAHIAGLVPRSGGEYRYLSSLLHPAAGYVAGWASLLVGFAAPIAAAASAAGLFTHLVLPAVPARAVAAVVVIVMTAVHAGTLSVSKRVQDVLSACKAVALALFVGLGLVFGSTTFPWVAAAAPVFPTAPFATSLVFIAYSMSGWNAAAYAAEDFRNPVRDVGRATVVGCAVVTLLYLAVNWIFLANLPQAQMSTWTSSDTTRVTLAHLVAERIAGPRAATLVSLVIVLSLLGSVSAMTWAGPRVTAAMARDGFLPRAFAGTAARPPTLSVLLQGALSLALLLTQSFEALLVQVGVVLTLSSAATALSLFRVALRPAGRPRPSAAVLCAAALYGALSAWMLVFALRASPSSRVVAAVVVIAGLAAYALSVRRARVQPNVTPNNFPMA